MPGASSSDTDFDVIQALDYSDLDIEIIWTSCAFDLLYLGACAFGLFQLQERIGEASSGRGTTAVACRGTAAEESDSLEESVHFTAFNSSDSGVIPLAIVRTRRGRDRSPTLDADNRRPHVHHNT